MRKFLLFLATFAAFFSSGLFTHFYNRDDDLSLRYLLWKSGVHPYPTEIIGHALIADKNGDRLVSGKSKSEILTLFPNAHKESINDYQKQYETELAPSEYVWIGDSNVVILFSNGLAERVSVMKG